LLSQTRYDRHIPILPDTKFTPGRLSGEHSNSTALSESINYYCTLVITDW